MRENGHDAVIFAVGPVLRNVLQAAEALEKQGVGVTVVDLHTLKPLDRDGVVAQVAAAKAVVTVEDHNVIGGLGSAVAEVMAEEAFRQAARRLGCRRRSAFRARATLCSTISGCQPITSLGP